ncbi:MAG: nucleotidyl transferase AbiEii/AbiGii toxin family protein, partial [Deltaproteobacteria bacterium]|nr:nucleotidyl transferase AbiEii/AbiGii toxin family protein [Deltaproteobacteria bacterium]
PKDVLSALQWEFLSFFFQGEPPFFLTGGTALSAFYLQHRYSEDLDLFTLDSDAFDRVPLYVADTATRVTATVAALQTAPQFRRYKLSRRGESVIVDFVREVVLQISNEKNRFDGIVVDTLDDITANKICTVISRAEIKDYIDLYFLARAGYPLENYIREAQQKDAGVSQAMLAYLLSEFRLSKVPDFMVAPVSLEELQEYFQSLARKLAVESFPR